MTTESNIFIGIDVSKDTLDISMNGKHKKIANSTSAISDFIKSEIAVTPVKPKLCALEATGGYELLVMGMLQEAFIPVHRAHPSRVYAFAQASAHSAKTDKLDALLLEEYAIFVHQRETGDSKLSKTQKELQDLRLVERSLEDDIHAHKCRLHHLSGTATKLLAKHIKSIAKKLADVRKAITQLIENDSELSAKNTILTTCIGIGDKTASILLSELPELGQIKKKEIASLVGVVPRVKESGKKTYKSKIQGGRFYVRKALYMSALVAVRHDGNMRILYEKLIAAGKLAKVALVAVMHQIIICLNAMIRDNKIYKIS